MKNCLEDPDWWNAPDWAGFPSVGDKPSPTDGSFTLLRKKRVQ